jgi:N-acetylglutamate synthase-like GNAT family acetyltransferase
MARQTLSRDGFVARLTRGVQPVADLLEPAEPATTRALSEHLNRPSRRWGRSWIITTADGTPAGAVILSRLCFDQWAGWVYLRDAGAAAVAGDVVQHSPAGVVSGAEADIRLLATHVPRARDIGLRRWAYVEHPIEILGPPDAHTRVATVADLDALVELYAEYEFSGPPTRWQLRDYLRRVVHGHFVVVYEEGGRLIGAMAVDGRTRRFMNLNELTVRPDHRRRGVAWSILARAQAIANGLGVGVTWMMAPSNPINHERLRWPDEASCGLRLAPTRRFPGEGRLRRLYQRVQPIATRRPLASDG